MNFLCNGCIGEYKNIYLIIFPAKLDDRKSFVILKNFLLKLNDEKSLQF